MFSRQSFERKESEVLNKIEIRIIFVTNKGIGRLKKKSRSALAFENFSDNPSLLLKLLKIQSSNF